MEEPIRVLHVLGGVGLGGAESRIMDLYRHIDRNKIQFDFLVHFSEVFEESSGRQKEFYEDEIKSLGGHIYALPKFRVYNYASYKQAAGDFFKHHAKYKVVQGHMTSTASIYLPEAKKAGIPITAAHARSAGVDQGIKGRITKLLRIPLIDRADYCFACSREAGIAVYGKRWMVSDKARVIPNAIDAVRFTFNSTVREQLRQELGVQDCFVIGHTGRFHYAKNHEYLIRIFAEVHHRMKAESRRAVLLLLGAGDGRQAVETLAVSLNVEKDILFMGNQKDVERYCQAMDFFVFPSRFEGLPGTVVEAQAAGLRCLISDSITKEVGFTELVHFESIDKPVSEWAEYILAHALYSREDRTQEIKTAGFDVREQAERMEAFYLTGKDHGYCL